MIALATAQTQQDSEWEVLLVRQDGSVGNDGTLVLSSGEEELPSGMIIPGQGDDGYDE